MITKSGGLRRVLWGGLAGLAGGAAMRLVVKAWERRYYQRPEHGPFGLDREADRRGAWLVWDALPVSRKLSPGEAEQLGMLLHYALGASAGAVYAAFPNWIEQGCGVPYGIAVWLIADLLAVSVSGVSDPKTKTLDSHVVAAVAHIVYGVGTYSAIRMIQAKGSN